MSSEAQRRANRRNALRSTGPKTQFGKANSSRNARRHGLSIPLELSLDDPGFISILEIVRGEGFADSDATEIALAWLKYLRVKDTYQSIYLDIEAPNRWKELSALKRYQRSAAAALAKAIRKN